MERNSECGYQDRQFSLITSSVIAQVWLRAGQIERNARLWQTWVFASASDHRPDSPSERAETIRELLLLREAAKNSAASAAQEAGVLERRFAKLPAAADCHGQYGLDQLPRMSRGGPDDLFVNGDSERFGIVEWKHTLNASGWFGWASRRLQGHPALTLANGAGIAPQIM